MELVCVRHGRTAWNADRRFQGQTDIPLDAEGLAQAQALGSYLLPESFDVVVASDLTRARTTAEALCAGRDDMRVELEPSLREMHFGVWEGLTWTEIIERWPELSDRYETSPRQYTPEGGETWEALCARVDTVLRRITARLQPDGRALIVSHAGVMHAILHVIHGVPADADGVALRIRLVPAGIIRLSGSFEAGWSVDAINETAQTQATRA
jgi:broad specificity phosphatase PhoE